MIYILFDKPQSLPSFISRMMGCGVIEMNSPQTKRKILGWIKGCLSVLKQSQTNDIIVCWYDFQAILCWWIGHLCIKKRKIVCVNILLKDKPTLKNRMVSYMYRKALLSENFVASVTSKAYGDWINEKLNISANYYLVRDVYHNKYSTSYNDHLGGAKYVFCGGKNGRDWSFMVKVAQQMPNVKFTFVMPNDCYDLIRYEIQANMRVLCDIPVNEFLNEMSKSAIVTLPLDTEAPAGLIVMFQAAANRKHVVMTDTVTTREYLDNNRGTLLPKDVNKWVASIQYLLDNETVAQKSADEMYAFLANECSEEKFVNGIKLMITCLEKVS